MFFLGPGSILGLIEFGLGIIFFLTLIRVAQKSSQSVIAVASSVEAISGLMLLPLAGMIFFFGGWRLDPILVFGLLLTNLFLITALLKDIALLRRG